MKRSDLNKFIKENIIETLSESPSVDIELPTITKTKANAKITNAKGFAQFILKTWNDISAEENESITQLSDLKIAKAKLEKVAKAEEEISEQLPSKDEVEDTTVAVQNLKKELDSLEEDDDIDDKDAVAQANKARGKHKKLDIAVKAKKALETEMKSLARKYSAADDVEKEKIKDDLKAKTAKKKELESLVAKLEKDVV
tara:strand:+ start:719 stop:1315 length:597 start_codon:yes stop_codon:yes gene_type:complete